VTISSASSASTWARRRAWRRSIGCPNCFESGGLISEGTKKMANFSESVPQPEGAGTKGGSCYPVIPPGLLMPPAIGSHPSPLVRQAES